MPDWAIALLSLLLGSALAGFWQWREGKRRAAEAEAGRRAAIEAEFRGVRRTSYAQALSAFRAVEYEPDNGADQATKDAFLTNLVAQVHDLYRGLDGVDLVGGARVRAAGQAARTAAINRVRWSIAVHSAGGRTESNFEQHYQARDALRRRSSELAEAMRDEVLAGAPEEPAILPDTTGR